MNKQKKKSMRPRRQRNRNGYDRPNVKGQARVRNRTSTGVGEYFPDRTRVRLTYEDYREFSPLAAFGSYVFSGNSAYDPDVTNVGRQPTGFDQYSAIYTRYRVFGSDIKISFVNVETKHAINVALLPTKSSSALMDYGTYAALPYVKTALLGTTGGMDRSSLLSNMSTQKINGITGTFNDLSYSAFVNGNPAERWYWQYFMESSDHVTVILVAVIVRIVYDVEFFARDDTGVSLLTRLTRYQEHLNYRQFDLKCLEHGHLTPKLGVEEESDEEKIVAPVAVTPKKIRYVYSK